PANILRSGGSSASALEEHSLFLPKWFLQGLSSYSYSTAAVEFLKGLLLTTQNNPATPFLLKIKFCRAGGIARGASIPREELLAESCPPILTWLGSKYLPPV
ncbi:unnamed protein product, partial [Prunus brigantina]